jgi:hypothetical protein
VENKSPIAHAIPAGEGKDFPTLDFSFSVFQRLSVPGECDRDLEKKLLCSDESDFRVMSLEFSYGMNLPLSAFFQPAAPE